MTIFHTARLALHEFTTVDAAFIIELLNSESYIKYIGRRNIHTPEEAKKYIADNFEKSYTEKGFGFYVMELISDKSPIGICGIVKRDWLDDVDLGFALLPEYEGKGYANEASQAMLDYSLTVLNIKKIAAITMKENRGSIKLLKKLGLKENGTVIHPDEKVKLMLFVYANTAALN